MRKFIILPLIVYLMFSFLYLWFKEFEVSWLIYLGLTLGAIAEIFLSIVLAALYSRSKGEG